MTWSALELLAAVLQEARATLDASPERVAASTDVGARTIRRLEACEVANPRVLTLDRLGQFYGLNTTLLRTLVSWRSLSAAEVAERLRGMDAEMAERVADEPDSVRVLALRLARRTTDPESPAMRAMVMQVLGLRGGAGEEPQQELRDLVRDVLALDTRRRRLLVQLARELRRSAAAGPLPGIDDL